MSTHLIGKSRLCRHHKRVEGVGIRRTVRSMQLVYIPLIPCGLLATTNASLTVSFLLLRPVSPPAPRAAKPKASNCKRSDPPEIRGLSRPSGASLSSSFRPRGDHEYIIPQLCLFYTKLNGTPCRIRTYDPWLRRPMLYPAELRAHILFYLVSPWFTGDL